MSIKNMGLNIKTAIERDKRHLSKPPSLRKDNYVIQAAKDFAHYRELGYNVHSIREKRKWTK